MITRTNQIYEGKSPSSEKAHGSFRCKIHFLIWLVLLVPSFAVQPSLSRSSSSNLRSLVNFDSARFFRSANVYVVKVDGGNSSYVKSRQQDEYGQLSRWGFDTEMKESSVDDYIEFLNRRHYHLTSERDESESELRFYLRKWLTKSVQRGNSLPLAYPSLLPLEQAPPTKNDLTRPRKKFLAATKTNFRKLVKFWSEQKTRTRNYVKLAQCRLQKISAIIRKSCSCFTMFKLPLSNLFIWRSERRRID